MDIKFNVGFTVRPSGFSKDPETQTLKTKNRASGEIGTNEKEPHYLPGNGSYCLFRFPIFHTAKFVFVLRRFEFYSLERVTIKFLS